jgi:hypothetical protein
MYPYAGIIVRDYNGVYAFISVMDLLLVPKVRVNRNTSPTHMKGKWLLDMGNGVMAKDLATVLSAASRYVASVSDVLQETACVGVFHGEVVQSGGEYRTREMKQYDYGVTR